MASTERRPGIIILGAPRSGTTLLRRLLDAHPAIACPGETFLMRAAARFIRSERIAYGIDYGVLGGLAAAGIPEEETLAGVRRLADGFMADIAARAGKPRWASKTAVDSFYIEGIERIWGAEAHYVCVVRHGLDVACSLKEFSDELEGYIEELHAYVARHARPLDAFAHAWADIAAAIDALMARRPASTHLVRYEDLVGDPERTLAGLLAALGEAPDPGLLARAMAGAPGGGLGDWKTWAQGSISADSIGRWRRLAPETVGRLAGIVNPMLARFGYEPVTGAALPEPAAAMRRYELSMMVRAQRTAAASRG